MIDGVVHWVGKDVCDRLGYVNTTSAFHTHCKGAPILSTLQTAGGVQEMRVLVEADVHRLIVGSELPAAERFRVWLFEDVLPSIRKTGSYTAPGVPRFHPLQDINDLLVADTGGVCGDLFNDALGPEVVFPHQSAGRASLDHGDLPGGVDG
jgi:hypothetical protein